ncbi:glycine zipper 2TM domain-containing protein [Bordetella sp. FB-8]|uniref:outer membrane lipoprotein n=1 Tax=Bordetella sp. FB-8 TaxID=1159870 RepID=UPI00037A9A55|nr:glycine zipper 2TM domain-containing protein [Bordetella sp. FB-8]
MTTQVTLSTFSRAGRWTAVAALGLSLSVLAGCATPSASSSVYTYGQAQREQIVRTGTITSMRPITIEKSGTSGAGAVAGGLVGGVAGAGVGRGMGNALAAVGGAVIGALAGNAIEGHMGKTSGYEITVRLDNGETRVIAQSADQPLSVGQRVQVISGAGPTRVAPM